MKYSIALSAEDVNDFLASEFEWVGMIRVEYIFKQMRKYITIVNL